MPQFEANRDSKTVGWARFDGRILEIDFRNYKTGTKQSTYSYDGTLDNGTGANPTNGFPLDVWHGFEAAAEKASYFAHHIRPIFKGVKIWQA